MTTARPAVGRECVVAVAASVPRLAVGRWPHPRQVGVTRARASDGRVSELAAKLIAMSSGIPTGMLVRMRTTMNLPDPLMRRVRLLADGSNRTVTSVVEQALRELLARREDLREDDELLPTYGSPANRPLVDIDDRDQLYAALDGEHLR